MKIAVFCGSRMPENPIFAQKAKELGLYMAQHNITLIYGGANVGIMKVLADEMLNHGGHVIGIMPHILVEKEVMHPNLSEFIVAKDMSDRKTMINDMADGFIAFPGGCGTMDEVFEVITLNQIDYFKKPVGFANIDGFFNGIKQYVDHATTNRFITDNDANDILFNEDAVELLKSFNLPQ